MMKKIKKYFIAILGLFIFVGLGVSISILNTQGLFKIEKFEIAVYQPETQKNYIQPFIEDLHIELQKKVGQSLLSIDLANLIEFVKTKPWVKEVSARRVWPDQVLLQIETKEISYSYQLKSGALVSVFQDGQLFKGKSEEVLNVPLLSGKAFESDLDLRMKAVRFLSQIPDLGKYKKDENLEVSHSDKDGFIVTLKNPKLLIKLGSQEIEKKSHQVSRILEYLEVHQIQAESMDLNTEKKAFVKIKKNEGTNKDSAASIE